MDKLSFKRKVFQTAVNYRSIFSTGVKVEDGLNGSHNPKAKYKYNLLNAFTCKKDDFVIGIALRMLNQIEHGSDDGTF